MEDSTQAAPPVAAVEKHPEIRALIATLQAEKAALQAQTAPLHARYDALAAQISPLEAEQRQVADQFIAIERPRLGEIDMQISALSRAIGGRVMSEPDASSNASA